MRRKRYPTSLDLAKLRWNGRDMATQVLMEGAVGIAAIESAISPPSSSPLFFIVLVYRVSGALGSINAGPSFLGLLTCLETGVRFQSEPGVVRSRDVKPTTSSRSIWRPTSPWRRNRTGTVSGCLLMCLRG